jgi:hypothetical protein
MKIISQKPYSPYPNAGSLRTTVLKTCSLNRRSHTDKGVVAHDVLQSATWMREREREREQKHAWQLALADEHTKT